MTGKKIGAAVFAFLFVFLFSTSAFAVPFKLPNIDLQTGKKDKHPKMESVLSDLFKEHKKGKAAAEAFAEKRGLKIEDEEAVTVFLLLEEKKTIKDIDTDLLFDLGIDIIKSHGNVIKASVPLDLIETIADSFPEINFIKFPDKPHALVVTEGLNLTGAANYQTAGYTGSSVKLAVIDLGFKGLNAAITAGELPNSAIVIDCTGSGCVQVYYPWDLSEDIDHGTAVTEIIYDMTPNAQFYLIKIDDTQDLADAKDFCISNGIRIVNYSVGSYNQNFYSGECYNSNSVCTVNNAFSNNILWVNASGNHAQRHYGATFTDANFDDRHDTLISFYASIYQPINLYLTWNAWPTTNQDYDLYLFDSSLSYIVDKSETPQSGTQPPVEYIIELRVPYTGLYYVGIANYSATGTHKMELYIHGKNLVFSPYVSSGSLLTPADATGAFAVGAIDYPDWLTGPIAYYSSQGPTNDGRIKPEISAPAYVSTLTYGASAFPGTSAAAPHVAGAAALILSAHPSYSVSQLWNSLTGSAIDMGNAGPDNVFGYGRLNMPSLISITIGSNPSGRQIIVDGNGYTAPKTFNWAKDSSHTFNVGSPQPGTAGTQYVFSSWSDGGAQSHTIATPSTNATYTANFSTQYQLTTLVNPASSGTITIAPNCTSGCWYNSGSVISLSPIPSGGNTFLSWTGDISSMDSPLSFSLSGPKNITANFDSTAVTGSVRLAGSTLVYFSTIPLAYAAAANNNIIQTQAISYAGSLTFNRTGITVTLKGGYNNTFSNNTGKTTVGSPVTVQAGTIIADKIIIQ